MYARGAPLDEESTDIDRSILIVDRVVVQPATADPETSRVEPFGPERIAADPDDGEGSKMEWKSTSTRPLPGGFESWLAWAAGTTPVLARSGYWFESSSTAGYRYFVRDGDPVHGDDLSLEWHSWAVSAVPIWEWKSANVDNAHWSGLSELPQDKLGLIEKGGGPGKAAVGEGVGFGKAVGVTSGYRFIDCGDGRCVGSKLAFVAPHSTLELRFSDGIATIVSGVDPSVVQRVVPETLDRMHACGIQRTEGTLGARVDVDETGEVRRVTLTNGTLANAATRSCVLELLGAL